MKGFGNNFRANKKTTEKTPDDIEVEDPQTVSKENEDDAQITLDL